MHDYGTIFDDSYWRTVPMSRDGRDFIDGFYARFLSRSEEIRERFENTDFDKQKQVLLLSLSFMSSYATSGEPSPVLEKIARAHGRDGLDILPAHYETWLACLLDTVREYDPEWSPEVDEAWRKTLDPGIRFMQAHHREGGAHSQDLLADSTRPPTT